MASTLADIHTLANSVPFIDKVTAAMYYVGTDIIRAVVDMEAPTGEDKARMRLAELAIENPAVYGKQFARILAVQPSMTLTSSDGDVVGMVTGVWRYLSRLNL